DDPAHPPLPPSFAAAGTAAGGPGRGGARGAQHRAMSQTHFDDVADSYDETIPPHVAEHYLEKRTRFILEHCPRGRVLDVGCGTGVLASRLLELGYEVVGIDPSEGMLRVLRRRAPEARAVRGSGTDLPFEDGEFDTAVSVATMHHIA